MSKPIVLSELAWTRLHNRLARDHHSSVLLIREKMKEVLGFTVRTHREWIMHPKTGKRYLDETIYLDFYNESKRTFFLLKYGEFLDQTRT